MMRVLVTGGAGFIGSAFLRYLRRNHPGWRLICLDKLTYAGSLSHLGSLPEDGDFRFVRGDICDREAVYRLFDEERPDVVVNFAAESHVDRSIADPGVFLRTNVLGAGVLLDACLRRGVERYHQISTDEVYGDLPLNRPEQFFSENSPLRPSSPYSAGKAAADLLALACWRTYGLPVTVSRCSNNYGPRQFPEKLIPLTIVNCLLGRPLPVYGDGKNVRDWIYVGDHCRALDLIVRNGRAGEVYNVSGGNEMSVLGIVRLIAKETGVSPDLIAFVADRPGHDLRYGVGSAKIRTELGWKPETPFMDGLRSTIDWYRGRRGWWEPLLGGERGRSSP